MSRKQIDDAIADGRPFSIRMADGKEYDVPHRDYISVAPTGTFVTVYDNDDHYYVLPVMNMTGIASSSIKAV